MYIDVGTDGDKLVVHSRWDDMILRGPAPSVLETLRRDERWLDR